MCNDCLYGWKTSKLCNRSPGRGATLKINAGMEGNCRMKVSIYHLRPAPQATKPNPQLAQFLCHFYGFATFRQSRERGRCRDENLQFTVGVSHDADPKVAIGQPIVSNRQLAILCDKGKSHESASHELLRKWLPNKQRNAPRARHFQERKNASSRHYPQTGKVVNKNSLLSR